MVKIGVGNTTDKRRWRLAALCFETPGQHLCISFKIVLASARNSKGEDKRDQQITSRIRARNAYRRTTSFKLGIYVLKQDENDHGNFSTSNSLSNLIDYKISSYFYTNVLYK